MTNGMKVKHAVEVLGEIVKRHRTSQYVGLAKHSLDSMCENLISLQKLLDKPHETDTKGGRGRTDESGALAQRLLDLIKTRKHNFREPNINQWAVDMQTIIRLDKRTPEHLADVIDWCQQDDFWQDNILSPAKLRKQLDRLELKMQRDHKWQRRRKLTQPRTGKSGKELYMESLENDKDSGVNE